MDFGKVVKAHRTRSGDTQQAVAERLGISRTYLSLIETGKTNNLSFTLAMKLLNLSSTAHGQIQVTLPRRVFVDATIAVELVWLNESGVETRGCCTGPPAVAMIIPSSACRAKELGYAPLYMEDVGLFEIKLKSKSTLTP